MHLISFHKPYFECPSLNLPSAAYYKLIVISIYIIVNQTIKDWLKKTLPESKDINPKKNILKSNSLISLGILA